MKRAILLATIALLTMLLLAPMVMAQGTTMPAQSASASASGTPQAGGGGGCDPNVAPGCGRDAFFFSGSASGNASGTAFAGGGGGLRTPFTGGPPTFLLPAAVLLLGSGILTLAILRRR
jgi:hypothetical protein